MVTITNSSEFWLLIAALIAAAWVFFPWAWIIVNRLTDLITKRRRRP